MYSSRVIEQNLEAFAAKEAWMPVRHTFSEVVEFTAYIKSITTLASNSKGAWIDKVAPLTDKRRAEIRRWIQNEQVLCSLDYGYWRDNYAYCVDEGGQIRKFKNRRSQDVFDSIVAELEEQQAGIQILCSEGAADRDH